MTTPLRRNPALPIAFGLAALGLLGLVLARVAAPAPPSRTVWGRWEAAEGRHRGLVFEVTCERVLLEHAGDSAFGSHRITEIDVDQSGENTRYSIEFLIPDGNKDVLRLMARAGDEDAVHMSPTDERWIRSPAASAPWEGLGLEGCDD